MNQHDVDTQWQRQVAQVMHSDLATHTPATLMLAFYWPHTQHNNWGNRAHYKDDLSLLPDKGDAASKELLHIHKKYSQPHPFFTEKRAWLWQTGAMGLYRAMGDAEKEGKFSFGQQCDQQQNSRKSLYKNLQLMHSSHTPSLSHRNKTQVGTLSKDKWN